MSKLSSLADSLVGSEIVKLGNAIQDRIQSGAEIWNYTIGDFAPSVFPIPATLKSAIIHAYEQGYTNYPPAAGIAPLRSAVAAFVQEEAQLPYSTEEIQIASGGRPLIYSLFRTVVDAGDKVIYAIPSWNNNHYTQMNGGVKCEVQTSADNGFMPTAEGIAPYINEAVLLCLCTPQNPTGATMARSEMERICDLVVAENRRRGAEEKKLYVLFDQMYWMLTYGTAVHEHPVRLRPEMKDYTITIDGVSKAFAATGVRVGWGMGPVAVIAKMRALLSHIGAWAPMAEQYAVAEWLADRPAVHDFLRSFKQQLEERLWLLFEGFQRLKEKGYRVTAIAPRAAIYLTVQFDLKGMRLNDQVLTDQKAVTDFLLQKAGLAVVPFVCFGGDAAAPWYRISVGTCKTDDIPIMFQKLEVALAQLS